MAECVTYGQRDAAASQGWMARQPDRRFWSAYYSAFWDTHQRDGTVQFDGLVWRSENGKTVSFPCAVTDDFGNLVPVPHG